LPLDTPQSVTPPAPAQAPPAPAASPADTAIVQSGNVIIIADEINNALVIQTTPQIYPELERTIEALDVLRRQVLVDAQIYEVTLDDSLSFGLSAILQNRGSLTTPQTTASFVTPPQGTPSLNAQNISFIGRSKGASVVPECVGEPVSSTDTVRAFCAC